jgi:hypothetical protein
MVGPDLSGGDNQIAELELVTSSPSAAKNLADNYTGLPFG